VRGPLVSESAVPPIAGAIGSEIGSRLLGREIAPGVLSGIDQDIRRIAEQSDTRLLALELTATVVGQLITPGLPIGRLLLEPAVQGLSREIVRTRRPRTRGPIQILNQTRALQRRGLQTRISADPFFGNTVISTVDQDPNLEQFVLQAAQRRVRQQQDFSPIFRARERVVSELASTAASRGFRSTIDPNLRGGVFRETADSPLQFIEGDFL